MGFGRFLVLGGVAVALIFFMIARGYRDLVLTFGSRAATGFIVRTHQPPPGAVRAADYQVWYEFVDESGQPHSGRDVLPPAKPPPEDGRVLIAYSIQDPSVSRIASQVSRTPVAGVVFGAGLLVWSTIQFIRARQGGRG